MIDLLEVAEDAIPDITDAVGFIYLASTADASQKTITTSSSTPGQVVNIRLALSTSGSYVLATPGALLTFSSANQWGRVVRNNANDTWIPLSGTAAGFAA